MAMEVDGSKMGCESIFILTDSSPKIEILTLTTHPLVIPNTQDFCSSSEHK